MVCVLRLTTNNRLMMGTIDPPRRGAGPLVDRVTLFVVSRPKVVKVVAAAAGGVVRFLLAPAELLRSSGCATDPPRRRDGAAAVVTKQFAAVIHRDDLPHRFGGKELRSSSSGSVGGQDPFHLAFCYTTGRVDVTDPSVTCCYNIDSRAGLIFFTGGACCRLINTVCVVNDGCCKKTVVPHCEELRTALGQKEPLPQSDDRLRHSAGAGAWRERQQSLNQEANDKRRYKYNVALRHYELTCPSYPP